MSVMIVSEESINAAYSVLNAFCWVGPALVPRGAACQIERFRRFNQDYKRDHKQAGFKRLFRWAAVMNCRNSNRRYAHNPDFYVTNNNYVPRGIKNQEITLGELCRTLKTMECLRYNIADYYDDSNEFRELTGWIEILKTLIIEWLPEYEQAEWG